MHHQNYRDFAFRNFNLNVDRSDMLSGVIGYSWIALPGAFMVKQRET